MSEQLLYDQRAEEWNNTRDLPWNKIRYELTNYFIKKHIPENTKDILEIGCGNGIESLMLYQESYNFTLSDYSIEMIEQAKQLFSHNNIESNIEFIHSDVENLSEKITEKYNVILFNNVLEYLDNPAQIIATIYELLKPNGIIVIRHINRFTNVYMPAIYNNDLDKSIEYLNSGIMDSTFGRKITTYSKDEILLMIEKAKFSKSNYYGLMSLTGFIPNNEIKYDIEFYNKLKKIEIEMADKFPYYDIARFGLAIANK